MQKKKTTPDVLSFKNVKVAASVIDPQEKASLSARQLEYEDFKNDDKLRGTVRSRSGQRT